MRESISYTFLLNIVFVFIFTCFAIIMGLLSYFKAFKANTIILNEIEKYEGYNCLAKESIEKKLNTIGYITPFKVSCKSDDGKCDDSGQGYKVISYNLDFEGNLVYPGEEMNSVYVCDDYGCATNKHHQYGVYTYMYVDLPVVSGMIRVPFFSKTSIMYDFRNYYVSGKKITDVEESFEWLYEKNRITDKNKNINNRLYVTEKTVKMGRNEVSGNAGLAQIILHLYAIGQTTGLTHDYLEYVGDYTGKYEFDYRNDAIMGKLTYGKTIDSGLSSTILKEGLNGDTLRKSCGYNIDYSTLNIGG